MLHQLNFRYNIFLLFPTWIFLILAKRSFSANQKVCLQIIEVKARLSPTNLLDQMINGRLVLMTKEIVFNIENNASNSKKLWFLLYLLVRTCKFCNKSAYIMIFWEISSYLLKKYNLYVLLSKSQGMTKGKVHKKRKKKTNKC